MKDKRTFYLFDLNNPDNDICKEICNSFELEKSYEEMISLMEEVDEKMTFSKKLLYYLKSRHLTSKMIYERAYIDRRFLNKMVKNPKYHPSKKAVLALCIALRLDYMQSIELLGLAGYTFSPNSRYDFVYAYIIRNRIYNIDNINELLYRCGFPCLGE